MLGRYPLGRMPTGGDITYTRPPGTVIPPPIPGGTRSYRYSIERGAYPLGWSSLGGGIQPPSNPGGGLVLVPQPDLGVMRVLAWWPNTSVFSLLRIDAEGDRTPVRGAWPHVVRQATRHNYAQNPSAVAGLNGYLPGTGNPTLSQLTAQDTPRGTAIRAAAIAAGSVGLVVPVGFPGVQQPNTVAFSLRLNARATAVTVSVDWVDSDGVAISTTTASLSTDAINRSIDRYARQVVMVKPPINAATMTARILAAGMPLTGTVDVSAVTWEGAQTDGSYVDGATLGGTWLGVAELSESVIAPVQTVNDGTCPLDAPVSYVLSQPALVGGRIESDTAILDSGRRAWFTHPARPAAPVRVRPTVAPVLTYPLVQGTFRPYNSRAPVVVSTMRGSPTGTLVLDAETFTLRDELLDLLADGAPILLRAPKSHGYADMWLAVGEVEVDPDEKPAPTQPRFLSLPFAETSAPEPVEYLGVS